jgi:hypothetical protein
MIKSDQVASEDDDGTDDASSLVQCEYFVM